MDDTLAYGRRASDPFSLAGLIGRSGKHVALIIAYSALSVILTWPASLRPDRVPGIGGDVYFYLWDLWWYKQALAGLGDPTHTLYIFYPTGINLAFASVSQFNAVLSVPLQLLFGLGPAYTILWLLSFILAGYGACLLVQYLTGDWRAAFIAGLAFMFCPYHAIHALGHLNLLAIEWIPFYVLYLLKSVREGSKKNYLLAAVFLFLCTACAYEYGLFLAAFTALYLAYLALSGVNKFKEVGLIFGAFSLMALPIVCPMLVEMATSSSLYMYHTVDSSYSADLLGFLYPSTLNAYLGNAFGQMQSGRMNIENTVFAGYGVLVLSLVAVLKAGWKKTGFWAASAIVFSVISLGPRLQVNGALTGIALPYQALASLPIVSMSHVPGRWDILVALSLAVLAGYGMKYAFGRLKDKKVGPIPLREALGIVFCAVVIFEFYLVPYPTVGMQVPEFYHQLARDENSYAIFEIPDIGYHLTFPEYMFYQTVHGKYLVTGYTVEPDNVIKFTEDTPFVRDLYLSMKGNMGPINSTDIIKQNVTEAGPGILRHYNIRYVILHKDKLTDGQLEYAVPFLSEALGEGPEYYDNGSLIVYKVNNTSYGKRFILLGDGWGALESQGGMPARQAKNNATLTIYSPDDDSCGVSMGVKSIRGPGTLQVYCNGGLAAERPLPLNTTTIRAPVRLKRGDNTIVLRWEGDDAGPNGMKSPVLACQDVSLSDL